MPRRTRTLVDDTPVQLEIGGKTYLVSQMTLKAQFALQAAAQAALPAPVFHVPEARQFLERIEDGLGQVLEAHGASVEGLTPPQADRHLMNLRAKAQELCRDVLREAQELFMEWPGQVGTPEMSAAFMGTEQGLRLIVRHALLPHQPDLTDEDFERIVDRITVSQTERLVEAFMPPQRDLEEVAVPVGGQGPVPTQPVGGAGTTSTPSTGTSSTRVLPGITAGNSRQSIA